MQCASQDVYVQHLALLRYAVLGGILVFRIARLVPSEASGGSLKSLWSWWQAGLQFASTEGVHMLIYFSVSAVLDNLNVFGAATRPALACRADLLVALYTAALLSFLPNAFLAKSLKSRGYSETHPWSSVLVAVAFAVVSFGLRLRMVEWSGYASLVHEAMASWSLSVRVLVAGFTPPAVDFVQATLLISVVKIEPAEEILPSTPSLYRPLKAESTSPSLPITAGSVA